MGDRHGTACAGTGSQEAGIFLLRDLIYATYRLLREAYYSTLDGHPPKLHQKPVSVVSPTPAMTSSEISCKICSTGLLPATRLNITWFAPSSWMSWR